MEQTPWAQISALIDGMKDWRGPVMRRLRSLFHEAVPGLVEEWKWATPVFSQNGPVVALGVFKAHVKLNFFKGAQLEDPRGLFNAGLDAKASRGIDIHEGDAIDEPGIAELVRAAAALNTPKAKKR